PCFRRQAPVWAAEKRLYRDENGRRAVFGELSRHHVHALLLLSSTTPIRSFYSTMSDKVREFVEIPQQFVREGSQFMTRCTKPSEKGACTSPLRIHSSSLTGL
ncbi:unnamed protein product, partial [Mycena citricolor]